MMDRQAYLDQLVGLREEALALLRRCNQVLIPYGAAHEFDEASIHFSAAATGQASLLTSVLAAEIEHIKEHLGRPNEA